MYKVLSYFHRHLVDLSEAELSAVVGRKQLKLSIFMSNSTNNIHHINISDCKQFRANLFKFGKILIITYVSTINITFISLLYRMQRHINATINKFSILGKCQQGKTAGYSQSFKFLTRQPDYLNNLAHPHQLFA